jgi:hypothetical protein
VAEWLGWLGLGSVAERGSSLQSTLFSFFGPHWPLMRAKGSRAVPVQRENAHDPFAGAGFMATAAALSIRPPARGERRSFRM